MVEDYVESMETIEIEVLTNGRAFCALIGEVAVLPNGRMIALETAENMGFDACDAAWATLPTACLSACHGHLALLAKAHADRAVYDAAAGERKAAKAARKAARDKRNHEIMTETLSELHRLMARMGC